MTAIIDYDAGNIKSVEKALIRIGDTPVVTRDKDEILSAGHIILPGVGNFGDCMEHLRMYGLDQVIYQAVSKNIPFLGICVGLQLLFDGSEEAPGIPGLGVLKGSILKIPEGEGRKVPHMGWNNLSYPHPGRLFDKIPEGTYMYFVHSYYLKAADRGVVTAQTEYGVTIDASVEQGNVFATQFHPEKSSTMGLKVLQNFLNV